MKSPTSYAATATEAQIQHCIVQALRLKGYVVLETGKQRQQGVNSVGCPDLLVWWPGWFGWRALEVKTATGRVKPEQQRLADLGATVIVRSLDEALLAVERRER